MDTTPDNIYFMSKTAEKLTTNLSPAELLQQRGVIELLLAVVAFVTYAGTLAFGLVYDDRIQIIDDVYIRSWKSVPLYFNTHVWGLLDPRVAPNYYRPTFMLWLKANYSLFAAAPPGWHFTTVLLHVLATVQVFWLGQRLIRNRTAAAVAALLFAVHPVHVESVSWVCGLSDPLLCVLSLGAVLGYLRWQQGRSVAVYIASLFLAVSAYLSKEPGVMLPLLVVVSAWAVVPSDRKMSRIEQLALVPYFVLAAIYLSVRQHVIGGFAHDMANATVREMVLTWPSVIVFYLRQLFAPYQISLFHDLAWVESPLSAAFIVPLALIFLVIAALVYFIKSSNDRKPWIAALLWMSIPFAPVMYLKFFMEGEIVHDRYAYLPSIGFVFLFVLLGQMLLQYVPQESRLSRARAVIIAFVVVFTGLTFYNQQFWGSDLLLFTRSLEITPNSNGARLNLGTIYAEKGDRESLLIAKALFKTVTDRSLENSTAFFNLGHAEYQLGDYPNAEKHMFRALQYDSKYAPWWMHFAGIELRLGKYTEAEAAAREAIRLTPNEPGYHAALGAVLAGAKKNAEAEQEFNYELKLHPDNATARQGLAGLEAARIGVAQTAPPKK